jgi:hypothetical protein
MEQDHLLCGRRAAERIFVRVQRMMFGSFIIA